MVVHTAHGDLGLFGRFWILIIRAAQGFRVMQNILDLSENPCCSKPRSSNPRCSRTPCTKVWLANKLDTKLGTGLGTTFPWQMNGTINTKNNISNSILEDIKITTDEIHLGHSLFIQKVQN